MDEQVIWVHGNSGYLEEIEGPVLSYHIPSGKSWGNWTEDMVKARIKGHGLHLEYQVASTGTTTAGYIYSEYLNPEFGPLYKPWIHFHIPLISMVKESSRQWPLLRKIMLQYGTDYDISGEEPYTFTQMLILDEGGAIVDAIHVYDGNIRVFGQDNIDWQTLGIDNISVGSLTLANNIPIRYGLGISVRLLFKNQLRIGAKYTEHPFAGWPNREWLDVPNYKRRIHGETATKSKEAIISSVGCEFLPSSP